MSRASTSLQSGKKDVDGGDKPGHDGVDRLERNSLWRSGTKRQTSLMSTLPPTLRPIVTRVVPTWMASLIPCSAASLLSDWSWLRIIFCPPVLALWRNRVYFASKA